MRPDYKNWAPAGLALSATGAAAALDALLLAVALSLLLGAAFIAALGFAPLCALWRRAFDYGGTWQLPRRIVEGVAEHVTLPGGVFAIHDLLSPARFGDMPAFADALRREGYAEARLVDTTQGLFMSPREARPSSSPAPPCPSGGK